MASSDTTQALIAAFAFGMVVNAASAAVFLYVKGHGSSFLRNGLRLVLITFLTCAALWAQTSFIATLVDPSSTSSCQTVLIFAGVFDQLARVSLEQGLLWGINQDVERASVIDTYLPQGIISLRLIFGGVFVGFQRPSGQSVCTTSTEVLSIGVLSLVLDLVVIAVLLVRASGAGLFASMSEGSMAAYRSKGLVYTVVGLTVWTLMSIPVLIGIATIPIAVRTAVPAVGITVAIVMAVVFKDALATPTRGSAITSPEAPSPRDFGTTRDLQSRDLTTADSDYPPSRYEDVKREFMTSSAFTPNQQAVPGITKSATGVGGLSVRGQLFSPMRAQTAPTTSRETRTKRAALVKKGGRLVISSPILNEEDENSPFKKITTIDLATAAKNEQERRDMTASPALTGLLAPRSVPKPAEITKEEMMKREKSLKRKSYAGSKRSTDSARTSSSFDFDAVPEAMTTSTQLSPGVEEIRRRSPRQAPQAYSQDKSSPISTATTPRTPRTRSTVPEPLIIPTKAPSVPVRSPLRPIVANVSGPVESPKPSSPQQQRSDSAPRKSVSSATSKQTRTEILPMAPLSAKSITREASQKSTTQNFHPSLPKMPFPPPLKRQNTMESIESSISAAQADSRKSILPRKTSVKLNIRPSRQRPASPTEDMPLKSAKTPIQSRAHAGLPNNPRAHAIKVLAKEQGMSHEQTVMFINQIEYSNPDAVQSIIDDANAKTPAQSPRQAHGRTPSMVHRPRPIPRNPSTDRPIFPAEETLAGTHHRRSMSAGSILVRKTILRSTPGNPSQLPPLPPAPETMAPSTRPQPNDTRSMTWDEKMNMFYPTPLSASTTGSKGLRRRSSSVPELPNLPAIFKQRAPPRLSERKRLTETKDASVTDVSAERAEVTEEQVPNTSKFSVTTFQSTVPPPVQSWMILPNTQNRALDAGNRRSSPIIPAEGFPSPSVQSEQSQDEREEREDEIASVWGSIHSPAKAINLHKAKAVEVPPVPPIASCLQVNHGEPISEPTSYEDRDDGKETMTVMLDQSADHEVILTPSLQQAKVTTQSLVSQTSAWHHRVGEQLPSFSAWRNTAGTRKVPPPAPLKLYRPNTIPMKVQAEPSPLESPSEALERIKEQLSKFNEPKRESNGSDIQKQRMTLLADLEIEMGEYESHWQELQNDLTKRDSISTSNASPSRESVYSNVRSSMGAGQSLKSVLADRRASKRTSQKSRTSDETFSPASQADASRKSYWQQKLAEAQSEYRASRSDLRANNRMSFLAVEVPKVQLGSPTPPDSETEIENEMFLAVVEELAEPTVAFLWHRTAAPASPVESLLWAPTSKPAELSLPEIRVTASRPSTRKIQDKPLTIESSRLWQKAVGNRRFSTYGLWRPSSAVAPRPQKQQEQQREQIEEHVEEEIEEPVSKSTVQRPPRRLKRMTVLPDILESPKPLPDKRGTLGIYRFPWGEKSDTAFFQPIIKTQMFMAMPGTMTSAGPIINASLDARARRLESEGSFYEDMGDEVNNYSDYDEYYDDSDYDQEDDEDDGFDDATLWEIADLLNTKSGPSRDSLLFTINSPHFDSDLSPTAQDHQTHNDCSEVETESTKHDSILVIDEAAFPRPPSAKKPQELWNNSSRQVKGPSGQGLQGLQGLPQPEDRIWNSYLSASASDGVRAPPRGAHQPALSVSSSSLWSQGLVKIERDGDAQSATTWSSNSKKNVSTFMWTPNATSTSLQNTTFGLAQPDQTTWSFYLTEDYPIARSQTRRITETDTISSTSLWTSSPAQNDSHGALLWGSVNSVFAPTATTTTMWSPPAPTQTSSKGLPQPNASAWEAYLPVVSDARVRPRRAAPATIESTSLWTATCKVEETTQARSLWSSKKVQGQVSALWIPAAPVNKISFGLAQPQSDVWNAYNSESNDVVRMKPRMAAPAVIESTQLWSKKVEKTTSVVFEAPVSAEEIKEEASSVAPSVSDVKATSVGMWAPQPVVKHEEPTGLFSVNHKRNDFRTTTKAPAALDTARKVRISQEPLPNFASARLWNVAPLWVAPAMTTSTEVSEGLFSLNHKRSSFRTTEEAPAALDTVRKLRVGNGPLPELTSSSLWALESATTFTQDWISMSSTGPRSPSVSSTSSDNDDASTDTSSVKSSVTKASTVGSMFSSFGAGLRKGWAKKPKDETSPPPVPKVQFKQDASVPRAPKLHRLTVTEADWEVALCTALAASYSLQTKKVQRLQRPRATETEWADALSLALAASYPKQKQQEVASSTKKANRLTRRFFSPAEWDTSLKQAVEAGSGSRLWAAQPTSSAVPSSSQTPMWRLSQLGLVSSRISVFSQQESTPVHRRPGGGVDEEPLPEVDSRDLWRKSRADFKIQNGRKKDESKRD